MSIFLNCFKKNQLYQLISRDNFKVLQMKTQENKKKKNDTNELIYKTETDPQT